MTSEPALATVSLAPDGAPRRGLSTWLALALVVMIGVNVRAVFGVTPPLVPAISDDLSLTKTAASLLTSVPILAMAACAPLGHALTTRLGADRSSIALLSFLGVAELSRLWIDSAAPLVLSAALIGGALGAVSTLVPAFIAHYLPRLRGLATGVYSTSMALGVGLAAGTAQPITDHLGGWRVALALWGAAALLLVVALAAVRGAGAGMPERTGPVERVSLPLRERRAWFVTAVYVVPMFLGFGVIAWLPSLFIDHGISAHTAALYLVLFQSVQLISILGLTALTDRIRGRRGVFAVAMVTSTVGTGLLALSPAGLALPGLLLAGFGIGGASSLALVTLQDEATSPQDATRLSSMAMLFSFTAGAAGPFLMGALADLTGSLVPGFGLCFAVSALGMLLLIEMHPARPAPHLPRPDPAPSPDPQ
ncbi:CynX/NimT family MFS transporter [Nocardioides sp. zg-DK7169]|uniref:MFS transporter n=1 Tax=Nocardioides sp. zg-DK7169 TaxID=2736600 RepID=UPI00155564AD|nr:MFS transporter [Nocardioides sp. zg-DK7169]NPC96048.1 MFS transporter [Nocardioides sp. zg-DK7169]